MPSQPYIAVGYSHPEVKLARRLMQGKAQGNLFVAEGLWGVQRLLRAGIVIETMLMCPEMLQKQEDVWQMAAAHARQVYTISQKTCANITDRDATEGCFLICQFPQHQPEEMEWPENALVVIMDGLEKPGNIGNIIRSLEGAGGMAAIITHRKGVLTHQRMIRASLGAAWCMPILDMAYEALIPYLAAHQFKVVLTDLTTDRPYYDADYSGRVAIVVGNEIQGISDSWRTLHELPVERVMIPMAGECESLNVGIATTIVAFEAGLRQRGLLTRAVPNREV